MTADEELTQADVEQMVAALFQVSADIQRGRHRNARASALTLLQVIAAMPGASPTELAAVVSLHQSSITRQVSQFEEAGFVTLTISPHDRRSVQITLTEAGRAELERLFQIGVGRFAAFVGDWDVDEVRAFTRLLLKFEASKAEVARREHAEQESQASPAPPKRGKRRWQTPS